MTDACPTRPSQDVSPVNLKAASMKGTKSRVAEPPEAPVGTKDTHPNKATTHTAPPGERTSRAGAEPLGATVRQRSSVHFLPPEQDGGATEQVPQSSSAAVKNMNKSDLRQSMADFLAVMYDTTPVDAFPLRNSSAVRNSTDVSNAPARRANKYKAAARNAHAGTSDSTSGDRIDTLVNHLVSAISIKGTSFGCSSREGVHGRCCDGEAPIQYGRGTRRTTFSARTTEQPDTNEVSNFVSQAMDNVLLSSRKLSRGLSKKSMLSSLWIDKNFSKLMSFGHLGSMQMNDMNDDESVIQPLHIGQQAMFQSVGSRPAEVSVSRSLQLRGNIPFPHDDPRTDGGALAATSGHIPNPLGMRTDRSRPVGHPGSRSGVLPAPVGCNVRGDVVGDRLVESIATNVPGGRAVGPKDQCLTRNMSLDSRALGRGTHDVDSDDSWGDVGTPQKLHRGPMSNTSTPTAVSNTRSLMELSRMSKAGGIAFRALQMSEEEALKRNVVIAVEKQLRHYIDMEIRGKSKPHDSSNTPRHKFAAPTVKDVPSSSERSANARTNDGAGGKDSTAPLVQNLIDFFSSDRSGTKTI